MLKINFENKNGVISLILISIIAFLTLTIVLTISFLSGGDLKLSLQDYQANQSFYLSQSCAEIALMKLKEDVNYNGSENINIQGTNCQIRPILGIGNENRIIQTITNYQNQVRKIQINLAIINPQTQIISWQEVPEF